MSTFTEKILAQTIAERAVRQEHVEVLDSYITYLRGVVEKDNEILRIAQLDRDAS